jgi:hypothetical protein
MLSDWHWRGYYVLERLGEGGCSDWSIVTMVRDPIARNISAFFQERLARRDYDFGACQTEAGVDRAADELIDLLWLQAEEFFTGRGDWDTAYQGQPLHWFDLELKAFFSIDVVGEDFPRERGWRVYEGAQRRTLLIKLEKLDAVGEAVLSDFLKTPGFRLHRYKRGTQQDYALVYKRLLERIEVPSWYLRVLYDSPTFTRFYTEKERSVFERRWSR